jgi:hypothetical protein
MGAMAIVVFGMFLAGNIAVLKWKLERERYADAALDATILVSLAWIFGGSITGLAIATIASTVISAYLFISPPDKLLEKMNQKNKKGKKRKHRRRVRQP